MDDKFDDTLFSILKDVKTLPKFLDTVFGFLYRRTDFYHVTDDSVAGVGLPEGLAESYVRQAFMKYVETQKILENPVYTTEEIPESNEVEVLISDDSVVVDNANLQKNSCMDSYNGATYDNYSWSQSINDVDVQVRIPENLTAKQLLVDVTTTKISVKIKNSDSAFLEGHLCQKCKHNETIWSIDGDILQIHLEKLQEMWWDCFITTETKLDLTKMDCSRPFHELSEEAQAKIEELTWNQERKRQGLSTTDQMKLEETLKKAWNVEGSPFTGEYDPTKVSLN